MKFFFCFLLFTLTAFTCNAQSTEAIKFDEYGSGLSTDEQDRLDEFARELKTQPEAQVYILSYGGPHSCVNDARKNAVRVKSYLVKQQIDASRIVTVEAGYKEAPTFEFWIVPSGASPPNVSPSVDPSEVVPDKSCFKTPTKKRTKKSTKSKSNG
jgi:hypothetical protein